MRRIIPFICLLITLTISALGQSNPQIMMQGWYWDYPKTGQSTTGPGSVSFNWSDTLRLKAASLGQAGFTHVWYPPFAGNGNKSGGYDPRDLFVGPSQTSLGTLSQIKSMVSSMTAVGITPVADMVYNHRDAGYPENNPAVKEYMLNYAGANNGSCSYVDNGTTQVSTYKQPYPSDRVRMVVPVGGSTGLGSGDYYININSRSGGYVGKKIMFFVTTNRVGKGQAWDFVNGCTSAPTAQTVTAANGTYVTNLKQGYLVTMNYNYEFKVTLDASNFNSAGDSLFIQAVNFCGDYSDHRIWKIWAATPGFDIADVNNQYGANYRLLFQTYTDFSGMPSGMGSLDWRAFRPNWNGLTISGFPSTGGATSTCLGPQYSAQSLDYFNDYDHSQSSGHDLLIDWTKWAYSDLGSKGLRMDAVKHFEPKFVSNMLNSMNTAGKNPNLVVGEWYGENLAELKNWVDGVTVGLNTATNAAVKIQVFDFSLRRALKDACDNGTDPRNAYFNSLRFNTSNNLPGYNIVTFLNNHDMRGSTVANGDALVHNNADLGYAWLLTNNQLGTPTVFYPDYFGYPARNTTYGTDLIGFDYHPLNFSPLKTKIDNLIKVHKKFITGSTGMDLLNHFGNTNTASAPTNYIQSSPNKALIYQLRPGGTIGNKEVIVAINFDSQPLRVDHLITMPLPNGIVQGSKFGDVLGRSNFPQAVVDGQNRIYIDLPAKSYSVWVQDAVPLSVTLVSTTVCAGQSNTLTASITGGNGPFSYSFSAGATAIPGSTSLASLTAAGPYSVTVTDDFGVSVTATVSSTFNVLPTITITPSSTAVCAGSSVTLTASGAATYIWMPGNTTAASLTVSPSATTNYTVTGTNANGCTATAQTSVTVNALPVLGSIASTSIACFGGTGSFTVAASSGTTPYTFALNTGANNQTGVFTGLSAGSYTISLSDASSCSAASTSVVAIGQPAAALTSSLAPSATAICGSVSVTLTATASSGTGPYQYNFGGGSSPTSTSVVSPALGSNAYSLTVTDANGCTAVSTTNVQGNSIPTATLTPTSATLTCAQPSVTLTAGGGTSYSFSTGQSGAANTLVVSTSGTYSVVVTNAGGCTASASASVASDSRLPTVSIAPTSGTLTCTNQSLTLTASGSGTAYSWTGGTTGTSLSVTASGPYTVTATSANGCSNTAITTVVSNFAAPSATLTPSSATLTCTQTSVTLTAGGGGSYSFSTGTTVNPLVVSSAGTYSVLVTGANGCTAAATATVVSNTAAPTVTITPSSTTFCGSLLLTASGTGFANVLWNTGANTPAITVTATGPYSVTATGANGCTATASNSPTAVAGGLALGPVASSSSVCEGGLVVVPVSVIGGASTFQWYRNGSLVSGQTSATLTLNPVQTNQSGSYVLVATGGCGSATSTAFNLTVGTVAPTVVITFPNGSTVVVNGTLPTITIPRGGNPAMQISGGNQYERMIRIDRTNGYELRQVDTNTNGFFPINRSGLFQLTITGPTGCRKIIEGIIQIQP